MSGIVEMVRNSRERNGRDRFSCSRAVWELLQELGVACGWHPQGTTYVAPPSLKVETPVRHNYQPGDPLDYKRVDATDAMAWASALEKAKQSRDFDSLIKDCWNHRLPQGPAYTPTLQSLIFEFIDYAYGGEFSFANAGALQ
jgi:hypothetical protein